MESKTVQKRITGLLMVGLIGITVEEIGNYNITNAIRAAWISIGNLLMFVGLLIMTRNKRTDT